MHLDIHQIICITLTGGTTVKEWPRMAKWRKGNNQEQGVHKDADGDRDVIDYDQILKYTSLLVLCNIFETTSTEL
jgi:hypothetical protein